MSIDDFSDLFTETITHEEFGGRNSYSKRSFGSPANYSARVVKINKLVKASDGGEVLSTTQVWIQGTPTVTPEDRITLPDGTTPIILSVEKYPDDNGDHHVKVFMG